MSGAVFAFGCGCVCLRARVLAYMHACITSCAYEVVYVFVFG